MKSLDLLIEAEKQARLVTNGLSVLRQMSQRMDLHTDVRLYEEFIAMGRARRGLLRSVQRQLEADPLLAHLLKSRMEYRRCDEHRTKSGKRLEEMVRSTFFVATSLGFRG